MRARSIDGTIRGQHLEKKDDDLLKWFKAHAAAMFSLSDAAVQREVKRILTA